MRNRGALERSTLHQYRQHIDHIVPKIGQTKLADLNRQVVQDFQKGLFDGAYIVIAAVAFTPLFYLSLVVPSANLFSDNFHYLVAAPFVAIFAFMLRPARKISFILVCFNYSNCLRDRNGRRVQDKKCTFGFLDQVTNNYAPSLIARQIAYKIYNESHQFFAPLVVVGKDLVLAAEFKPDAEPNWQLLAKVSSIVHQSYCSDVNPYWLAARRINYNLILLMYKNSTVLHRQHFTPKDCPAWPTDGASK